MNKLDLPLAKALTLRDLHHRVPQKMDLDEVGFFQEVDTSIEDYGFAKVFRVEARIGAQLHLDPYIPEELKALKLQRTKGDVLRHVYGPIYSELRGIYMQMRFEGRDGKSVVSLENLLNQLDSAFKG